MIYPTRLSSLIYNFILAIIFILNTNCSSKKAKEKVVYTPEQIAAESDKANMFFDAAFDKAVDLNPELQTSLGIKKDYDKWYNRSEAYAQEENKRIRHELEDLRNTIDYDKLDEKTRLSFRYFEYQAQQELDMFRWRFHNYPINQMDGLHSTIPAFLINMHRIDSAADALAYIERLRGMKTLFAQVMEGLKIRDSLGIRPPRFVYPMVISDCRNVISGAPFDYSGKRSPLFDDFVKKVNVLKDIGTSEKGRLMTVAANALVEEVKPAYNELIAYLNDQEKRANDDDGAWKWPDGSRYYKAALSHTITMDMSPDEIFEIGKKEVARIHSEMREIMKRAGHGEDSLLEFFEFMRKDKRFYFPNTSYGREQYRLLATGYIDSMRTKLDDLFLTKPKAAIEVKAVEPFREQSAGGAFYEEPALDGSRPGRYYINLYNMDDQPIYQAEALAYHEGIPGHHMQIAIAQELKDVPKFQKFGGNTAYVEGWALYTELLPKEYGMYKDPYSDFGRLANEVFRAARLVVDVGIHYKKWNRNQAYTYFLMNTPNPEGDCRKEIDRYIVWPAQATGYKIGMNRILELREKAKNELGDKFDIREFHDVILTQGPLPLKLLTENVRAWIESKQKMSN